LSPSSKDALLAWTLRACALACGVIVLLIAAFLVLEALPVLRNAGVARLLTDVSWHPTPDAANGTFNLLPMLVGSLLATVGAVLLASPLGILSALFCHYYAPPLVAKFYRRVVEVLAGVPSVVCGFWGLVTLVPLINELQPPGASLLAGIFVLAIMIVPTVALFSDAALAAVPQHYVHGAAALGLSRVGMLRAAVFPAVRAGLLTAVIIAAGRAIGETMAILMVCGNIVQIPNSVFDPVRTVTANIALEMAYAMGDHRAALFASGLMLLVLITGLVLLADVFQKERRHA
jgi:phosphate transport system permease protein